MIHAGPIDANQLAFAVDVSRVGECGPRILKYVVSAILVQLPGGLPSARIDQSPDHIAPRIDRGRERKGRSGRNQLPVLPVAHSPCEPELAERLTEFELSDQHSVGADSSVNVPVVAPG